jgi:hypothetical protein
VYRHKTISERPENHLTQFLYNSFIITTCVCTEATFLSDILVYAYTGGRSIRYRTDREWESLSMDGILGVVRGLAYLFASGAKSPD